jgi:hypothetical protein
MATNSVWVEGLLDEAAAIVEAEWVRLQDEALWEDEVTDLFTDLPAPRAAPPPTRVTATTERPWSCPSRLDDRRRWPTWRGPAAPVWATQRSPPLRLVPLKDTAGQGEVMN